MRMRLGWTDADTQSLIEQGATDTMRAIACAAKCSGYPSDLYGECMGQCLVGGTYTPPATHVDTPAVIVKKSDNTALYLLLGLGAVYMMSQKKG